MSVTNRATKAIPVIKIYCNDEKYTGSIFQAFCFDGSKKNITFLSDTTSPIKTRSNSRRLSLPSR
jgi:hypothetical protein